MDQNHRVPAAFGSAGKLKERLAPGWNALLLRLNTVKDVYVSVFVQILKHLVIFYIKSFSINVHS